MKDHIKSDKERICEYDPLVGDVCYRFSNDAENNFFKNTELCFSLLVYLYAKGKDLPDTTFLNRCTTEPDFDYVYQLFEQKAFAQLLSDKEGYPFLNDIVENQLGIAGGILN